MREMYKYYHSTREDGTQIDVCVTHYAQQTVRGIAKCAPDDEYDPAKGTALAKARCDMKYYEKKLKAAQRKVNELRRAYAQIAVELANAEDYVADAEAQFNVADIILENTEDLTR